MTTTPHLSLPVAKKHMSRYQLVGFLPDWFIVENGGICQWIMKDTLRRWSITEQQNSDQAFSI